MTAHTFDAKHAHAGTAASPRGKAALNYVPPGQSNPMSGSAALLGVLVCASRLTDALQHGLARILDSAQLTVPQWLLLSHLENAAVSTLTEAATELNRDTGGLSRAAHLLQVRGLINISRDAKDRRSVQLSITEAGIALCKSLDPQMSEHLCAKAHQTMQALWQLTESAKVARCYCDEQSRSASI